MTKKSDITPLPMTQEPDLVNSECAIEASTTTTVLMATEVTKDLELTTDMVVMLMDLKDMIILPMDVMEEVMNKVIMHFLVLPVPTTLPQPLATTLVQLTQPLLSMLQLKQALLNMLLLLSTDQDMVDIIKKKRYFF